jgi:hypothetical protein
LHLPKNFDAEPRWKRSFGLDCFLLLHLHHNLSALSIFSSLPQEFVLHPDTAKTREEIEIKEKERKH